MKAPWDSIPDAVQTPGDWATVLIFGTVGFAGDFAANMVGLPSPLVMSGLLASGALGVKKGGQSWWRNRAGKKYLKTAPDRARQLKALFEENGFTRGADQLQRALDLYRNPNAFKQLHEVCDAAEAAYLAWEQPLPPPVQNPGIQGDTDMEF